MTGVAAVESGGQVREVSFDEFVAARSHALLRTAYLLTHEHALAEDLLQTALTKAWFAWKLIDGAPEPYVRKILFNTYASWWRRRWSGCRAGCAR
jgi:DNA-directed RNA polymerase specialized sigma24 family protein